jgi:hypothetical protein
MLPWALALPVLKHRMPIPRLVDRMGVSRSGPFDPAREQIVRQASWWASRVQVGRYPDNCLERSLLAYRYLTLAGADPRVVLGIGGGGEDISGHAWVTLDGHPVHDPPESLDRYRRLIELGAADAQRTTTVM